MIGTGKKYKTFDGRDVVLPPAADWVATLNRHEHVRAAAPELYEVVRRQIAIMEQTGQDELFPHDYAMARQALAKARGEPNA